MLYVNSQNLCSVTFGAGNGRFFMETRQLAEYTPINGELWLVSDHSDSKL